MPQFCLLRCACKETLDPANYEYHHFTSLCASNHHFLSFCNFQISFSATFTLSADDIYTSISRAHTRHTCTLSYTIKPFKYPKHFNHSLKAAEQNSNSRCSLKVHLHRPPLNVTRSAWFLTKFTLLHLSQTPSIPICLQPAHCLLPLMFQGMAPLEKSPNEVSLSVEILCTCWV